MMNNNIAAPIIVKRGPGRPRKIVPPNRDWPSNEPPQYCDAFWHCWPADKDDHSEFERLLAEERAYYESPQFNPEISAYEDDVLRRLVQGYRREFTPEGLLYFTYSIRGPFTHEGKLTPGGRLKADVLLCRERLMAGIVRLDHTPDFPKLRDCLGPILFDLFTRP